MLWDLKISCRSASRLRVNTQRQPVRPCMFRTLSIYNNNTKPIIINNGQVIAEIDNRTFTSKSSGLYSLTSMLISSLSFSCLMLGSGNPSSLLDVVFTLLLFEDDDLSSTAS